MRGEIMVRVFRILHNFIVSVLIFSLSLSFYASANNLTLGISGQIKDRCEINFFSGNIMNFTEHRDVHSLPFNMYCNRPLGITINSKYGGLKYQHQGVDIIESYNLSLQIDEIRLYESRHSSQLTSPVMINSSGVIPFAQHGSLRVALENSLRFAGYYQDVIEIEVYPSIHSVTK
ncbi:hypothetical protein [Vibrio splendidus]|uniref:hypothetical protein n=1 Tax=Vibrio splendidus TaxID=29497 RepID=UPI001C06A19B|nr:hypothetical protein [Vibrio splendidus]MBU2908058.1 hypothetical protein [Vibrio splendidus]MDO6532748.1 hypothetical protein [Vibrio splendidus]MDO6553791.1 hypothetical protein [Vibrio splendidus]